MSGLPRKNLFFRPFIGPEVWENARRKDQASFFEEEGLKGFLHLEWDIKIDYSLVLEFLDNYDMKNQTVSMSTGVFSIDDKLMLEVFHLPSGNYRMPKKRTATKIFLPDLTVDACKCGCFNINQCTDEVWRGRLVFLHQLFCANLICCQSWTSIPSYFMEFLQAKGKKRNWFDAFRWFFEYEIRSIWKGSNVYTNIGFHISLLLAHIQKKKMASLNVGPMQQRVTFRDSENSGDEEEAGDQLGEDEENEAAKPEGETHQDELGNAETGHPSLNTHYEDDQILKHIDIGREGISKLLIWVAGLRDEVESGKSEYGNRSVSIAELGVVNDSLKTEVEKWKSAFDNRKICMEMLKKENDSLRNDSEKWKSQFVKAEQAREELEENLAAFWTTINLGTTKKTTKQATPALEGNSSGLAKRPSKKMKMENTG